jgi:Ca2+-binding RTX toxin-like protein
VATVTAYDIRVKTHEFYWPLEVDDLTEELEETGDVWFDEDSIALAESDEGYQSGSNFQVEGAFAYEYDAISGNVTVISGTVTSISWSGYSEGDHGEFFSWGRNVSGLNLPLASLTGLAGPDLELLFFSGDDDIHGAQYDDSLRGLAGADHLAGKAGKDTLKGGEGTDWLTGDNGNDKLFGGLGDDVLDGGSGKDTLTGGEGRDAFRYSDVPAASSADRIADFTHGEDKFELLGSAFAAIGPRLERAEFYAKAGATTGHDASDRIVYDTSSGRLYYDKDGSGGATSVHIATLSNKAGLTRADFEIPAVFRDTAGNNLTQTFTGPTTVSEFYFGDASDTIVFDVTYPWSDVVAEIDLGSGNDVLQTHGGIFRILGGAGRDTIISGGSKHTISGGDGDDSLTGGSDDDQIFGERGNDVLSGLGRLEGGEGNDTLQGSLPASFLTPVLVGGSGDDVYIMTHKRVLIIEKANGGHDTVRSTVESYLPAFVQDLVLDGDDDVRGTGNSIDNVLTGNSGDNRVRGMSGNDTLDGRGGNDTLSGEKGSDAFRFTSFGDNNADTVQDFNALDDTIALDHTVFLDIKDGGKLTSGQFLANTTGLAERSTERIVYNTADGKLYWDRDGSGTTYAPQHFATLEGAPVIKFDDFLMV